MYDSTITKKYNHDFILLKNEHNTIPLKHLGNQKMATVDLSNSRYFNFQQTSNLYTPIDHFRFNTFSSKRMIKAMAKEIKEYDLVLIITDTLHASMYSLFDEIGTDATTALSYLGHDHFVEYEEIEPFFDVIILQLALKEIMVFQVNFYLEGIPSTIHFQKIFALIIKKALVFKP